MTSDCIETPYGNAVLSSDGRYQISTGKHRGEYLHRLIFEDFYKIKLPSDIVIHHDDGDKINNNIWNLIPLTQSEHLRIHMKDRYVPPEIREKCGKGVSQVNTTTGLFRVTKQKNNKLKQGFTWRYQYYDENHKRKTISRVNLEELKKEVLSKGLEWIDFMENDLKYRGISE